MFQESVLLFSLDATSPNLGFLDCEKEKILCATWFASPPSIFYFQVPAARIGEERPPTPLSLKSLNATSVTADTIYTFFSEKRYANTTYEGILHPTDGFLAKYKLNLVAGCIFFGFAAIPSWLFMIGISLLSRTVAYVTVLFFPC